jgi:hydrogenase expression/formation protein HypD
VSVVIGEQAYAPVCKSSGKPCVIAGFEPVDLAQAVLWLVRQVARGEARVENAYSRVVRPEGNPAALRLISEVFEPADAEWRGLGVIPGSGLKLRPEYAALDATSLLPEGSRMPDAVEPAACRCGEVLAGRIVPPDCASFGTVCTPDRPLGACMVSQEGACRAYYRYGGLGVRA